MASTTIRVSRRLHDRLTKRAAGRHTTLAEAIEHALDAEERTEFWANVEATMGTAQAQATIRVDTEALSRTLKDGLDPDERWDDVL
jgi:predicted transcriptional regulator